MISSKFLRSYYNVFSVTVVLLCISIINWLFYAAIQVPLVKEVLCFTLQVI